MVRGISGLDDLARIFCPNNRNHQRAFLAIWLGIKYAEEQFLASSTDLRARYGVSSRTIEIVRAKMKKLGLIQRVSHFSPAFGGRSGWVFSPRFRHALSAFGEILKDAAEPSVGALSRHKDENSLHYISSGRLRKSRVRRFDSDRAIEYSSNTPLELRMYSPTKLL